MSIKELIESKGLTPYRIEQEINIRQTTITGRSNALKMPLEHAAKLSTLMDMTIDQFYRTLSK